MTAGCKVSGPVIWLLACMQSPKESNGHCMKPFRTETRYGTLTLGILTARHLIEYVQLWRATQYLLLRPNNEDTVTWKFTPTGEYSSSSAYKAQFIGSIKTNFKDLIWQSRNASGFPIDYRHEAGPTQDVVPFVDIHLSRPFTSSQNADLLGFVGRSRKKEIIGFSIVSKPPWPESWGKSRMRLNSSV
ncbi:LOW QUALITY PROTEIN: hypothetical protein U9M48_022769 [Paspalum notatum var. saurae]|uniref:Uncharacterized protein n=1 Tax=Paspalum notatum var. saurae TaxID=547442 RepID=A0AAQ3WUC0_PASNO